MPLPLSDLEARDSHSLASLPLDVEEELRLTLLRYHIPELDAESLLREAVVEMLYKADGLGDFGRRVGPVLQAKCRAYWQTRRWRRFNTLSEDFAKSAKDEARRDNSAHPRAVAEKETLGSRLVAVLRRTCHL